MVVVELVFGVGPEAFNPVNVVVTPVGECFSVVDFVVLSKLFEGVVAFESVGVKHRSLPGFTPNDIHESGCSKGGNHPRVDFATALQEAQNDTLPCCSSPLLSFPSPAEVRLVNLHCTRESFPFQLALVVETLSDFLVDIGDRVVRKTQLLSNLESGTLVDKPQNDTELPTQTF